MLIGDRISTKYFHYRHETRMFVTDDSDLFGFCPRGQLWDDSADVGFVMVSEQTGREIPFYLYAIQHEFEGGVQYWDFMSYGLTPEVRVRIFND